MVFYAMIKKKRRRRRRKNKQTNKQTKENKKPHQSVAIRANQEAEENLFLEVLNIIFYICTVSFFENRDFKVLNI